MTTIKDRYLNEKPKKTMTPSLRAALLAACFVAVILFVGMIDKTKRVGNDAPKLLESNVSELGIISAEIQHLKAAQADLERKHMAQSERLSVMALELEDYASREPVSLSVSNSDAQSIRDQVAYQLNCHMGIYGAKGLRADPNCIPSHLSY